MELQDKQKEFSMASGGRLFLLFGGIMLIYSALTSTGQYGAQMFIIASEAAKGTAEYVEIQETLGMGGTALRIMGVAFIVTALVEINAGIWGIRSCNRLDRSRTTLRVLLALLAVEIIMQIYLLVTHMSSIGMLVSALLMPLVMLWGATRLRKLAKLYPDRVYAIEKKNAPGRAPQTQQAPQQKKSLRERAMMSAGVDADESETDGKEAGGGIAEDTAVEAGGEIAEDTAAEAGSARTGDAAAENTGGSGEENSREVQAEDGGAGPGKTDR